MKQFLKKINETCYLLWHAHRCMCYKCLPEALEADYKQYALVLHWIIHTPTPPVFPQVLSKSYLHWTGMDWILPLHISLHKGTWHSSSELFFFFSAMSFLLLFLFSIVITCNNNLTKSFETDMLIMLILSYIALYSASDSATKKR